MLRELPELLVEDWYRQRIGTEHDMHVAAYHHIRKHFEGSRSDEFIIRAQPTMEFARVGRVKPDIVISRNTAPHFVLELKCMLDGWEHSKYEVDVEKLKRYVTTPNSTVRHVYAVVLYDDDFVLRHDEVRHEPWMGAFTLVAGNVRLHPDTGRPRVGYARQREYWEGYHRSKL